MAKPFAWSYSALAAFETCPRQYHEMRIKKAWPDPPGEVQQWGVLCHSHLEARVKSNTPLPSFLAHLEPIIQRVNAAPGEVHAEYKYALDQSFQPVEFFARTAWVRAVGDLVKVNGAVAYAQDYKFGKYREGDDQLKLQAAIMMATHPQLEKTAGVYVWVKAQRTTVRTYTRDQLPEIWGGFLPRVKRMEQAYENQDYPPRPSGLCRQWCHVKSCEFWGKGAF